MDMMELIIKVLSGETRSVHVNPSDTIGELKQQIAPLFETTPSRLRLSISNGQNLQLDCDQKTVRDYGLSSRSTVMLLISTTPAPFPAVTPAVFVKNEKGQTRTYDVTDDETVDQLMRKVYEREGTPINQQRLIYNGQQLESGKRLQDYKIVSESTIYMTLRLRGG